MKRLFYTLIFLSGFYFSTKAQNQDTRQTALSSNTAFNAEKMAVVRKCPELNEQLIKVFGRDYAISDAKILAQLEKNLCDKSAST